MGMPDFDFRLSVYHGDLSLVPGLDAWLRTVLGDAVFKCVPQRLPCTVEIGALRAVCDVLARTPLDMLTLSSPDCLGSNSDVLFAAPHVMLSNLSCP